MFPALTALCGVFVTAAVAVVIDRRHHADRAYADVWRAINSLRDKLAENNEFLAEIKGLLTGLFREVLDDPEVWRPPQRRTHEGREGRQRSVDT